MTEQTIQPKAWADEVPVYCAHDKIEHIDDVHPNPKNPNQHPPEQIKLLAAIIKRQGWRAPITVSTRSGCIVKGHGRLIAAREMGATKVPIDYQNYNSDEEELADLIADNRIAELAEIDNQMLAELFAEIKLDPDFDISLTGFTEEEYLELLGNLPEDAMLMDLAEDDVPELDEVSDPITYPGDVWELGRHRLVCGDSTKDDTYIALLGEFENGEFANLIITDPPYNVDYEGTAGKIMNDNMSSSAFYRFLRTSFTQMYQNIVPGSAAYVFHADSEGRNFRNAFEDAGFLMKQCLVWVKNALVLGRQDYHWIHEPCQPAGTMVRTPNGDVPIELLKDGDRVISFDTHSSTVKGFKDGYEIKTAQREYNGTIYGIRIGQKQTWTTDNHQFSVRFNPDTTQIYCTYLMRKGDRWRVGISKTYNARGFGLKHRMLQEKATEGWIIDTFDSRAAAQIGEQLLAVKYGIPYTHWETEKGFLKDKSQRTKDDIEWLYEHLDPAEMNKNAERMLRDYGRSRKYPLVNKQKMRQSYSRRTTAKIESCNLIPDLMLLPVPYDKWDSQNNKTFDWMPIEEIQWKPFSGTVYSLAVETHEHYIADGLVTHNCLYGWKEGAAHHFVNDRSQTTVFNEEPVDFTKMKKDELLKFIQEHLVKEDIPTTVIYEDKPKKNDMHPTMKPIKLISRLMVNSSKKGWIVLDPFAGSGSTLISAELTGRTARVIEMDPRYADVIVKRYLMTTGKQDIKCIRNGRVLSEDEIRGIYPESE